MRFQQPVAGARRARPGSNPDRPVDSGFDQFVEVDRPRRSTRRHEFGNGAVSDGRRRVTEDLIETPDDVDICL
jgi:hypothetical protein